MSKFSRHHYETIATAMQEIHPGTDGDAIDFDARLEMWGDVRATLADAFAHDNQLFMRDRFERACEPGANVRARTR